MNRFEIALNWLGGRATTCYTNLIIKCDTKILNLIWWDWGKKRRHSQRLRRVFLTKISPTLKRNLCYILWSIWYYCNIQLWHECALTTSLWKWWIFFGYAKVATENGSTKISPDWSGYAVEAPAFVHKQTAFERKAGPKVSASLHVSLQ